MALNVLLTPSLKTRIAVAISALVVLASGAIAVLTLTQFEAEKKNSLAANSFAIVSNIADDLDAKLRMAHSTVIAVAATVPPKALEDYFVSEAFLESQSALHALFDNGLFLVAPDGRLIGESPPRPKRRGEDVSNREYFHRTIETRKPYISKPYHSTHKPGQPALIMTAPVFDQGGKLIGLLYGSMDLLGSNILADLAKRRIGHTGYIYLADGRDSLIVHPDKSRIMKPSAAPGANQAFDKAIEGWEGTDETVNSAGVKALVSLKRIKTTRWIVGANLPLDEFYAPIREARRYFLWSTAISTLAILVLAWLLIHRLIQPLSNMTRQVHSMVEEPTAATRLTITSLDEIGVLGNSVNQMLDTLARNEQRLRTASLYTRSLIEASLDPLVTISVEGKITDVNQATEKVTGKSRPDLIGTDFSDYFTEPEKARAGYQQVLREGSVTDYALALRHESGEVMEVLYNASVYRNEQGEVSGVFAAARDITQRNQAEEKIRNLAAIVESSDDAIAGKTLDGVITSWNAGAERMYGYAASEVVGQPISLVIPPEHQNELPKILETIRAGKHVEHFETVRRKKDGEEIHVSLSVSPIRDSGGGIVGAATVARDITERKRAEEELRAASLYARSLIEASLDPLVTISAEGKITDVNEATVQATGMPRQLLVSSDFSEYFTEPDRARAGYKEVFAKGLVTDYPLALRHVSGKVTEVLYNASVYRNEKGEVSGVFAAARDITERKRAEDELRKHHEHLEQLVRERTSALETANHDLEGFAYSVSHDLRVPLRAIDGFSQQVLKHYADKLDDEGKRYLNVVRDNTKRMSQLIDDILAFSRMGRLGISVSEVNMEELAYAVFEELKPNLADRELRIEIKPLPLCRGDPSMLRQAWVNLLANAIKFTRPKDTALVEVGGHTEGTENIYYVKDNGAGFDMQYADKLFGVFQRLHGVTEFEGTGIGLAIVKRIVTRHGGRVWAEGKVNEGATFWFALPGQGRAT